MQRADPSDLCGRRVQQVLNELPLSFDQLRAHAAIAKRVKRISDRATDSSAPPLLPIASPPPFVLDANGAADSVVRPLVPPAAPKAVAAQLVAKWSKVQAAAHAGSVAHGSSSSTTKRKADEASGASLCSPACAIVSEAQVELAPDLLKLDLLDLAGSAKRAKTGTTAASSTSSSSSTTAQKSASAVAKPLPKALPSFKKQPSTTTGSAGAGGSNTLKEALAKLKAANGPKPPPPPPPAPLAAGQGENASSSTTPIGASAAPRRVGKPTGKPGGTLGNGGMRARKTVRWAEDSELEKVRWIEKAVYGDEDGHEIATVTAEGEVRPFSLLTFFFVVEEAVAEARADPETSPAEPRREPAPHAGAGGPFARDAL